jgi:hypothetical protein
MEKTGIAFVDIAAPVLEWAGRPGMMNDYHALMRLIKPIVKPFVTDHGHRKKIFGKDQKILARNTNLLYSSTPQT